MAASEKSELLPTTLNLDSPRPVKKWKAVGGFAVSILLVVLGWWAIATHSTSPSASVANESICGNTPNEAGYVKLANKKDDHYFYWFFEAQNDPDTAPLAIWLTGGPGGSSMLGLFLENGPCRVQSDLSTEVHPYSWNYRANMVWLDQPTTVGFSFTGAADDDEDFDESDVGVNLYWFLQGFMDKHPEFIGREFFLTGESYAGHYIPGAAHYIWEQNRLGNPAPGSRAINLQGISIGNGWTDPTMQYQHQMDILDNQYNVTLLSEDAKAKVTHDMPACIEETKICQQAVVHSDKNITGICGEAFDFCFGNIVEPFWPQNSNRNPYDIREECDWVDFGFCHGIPLIEKFLNETRVLDYLNAAVPWASASDRVTEDFTVSGDYMVPVDSYVSDLLDGGIRVLLYIGDADTVCGWGGNKAWINALDWSGKDGFNAAVERVFVSNDPLDASSPAVEAGIARSFENLALVRIFNAGHMVPTHQPAVALDLINRFFQNAKI